MRGSLLRLIIGLVWALSLVSGGPVYADGPSTLTVHYVDGYTNPPEVHAYLSINDANGNPVEGLGKESFAVREDDLPVVISELGQAPGGMSLAMVIDTSGSMMDGSPSGIQAAKGAAVGLIQKLDPADRVAVLSFDETVITKLPLSPDHGAAINTINGLAAQRKNTALYDACFESTSLVAMEQKGRRVVVLLTDGVDTSSKLKVEDCLKVAGDAAVPIYTVGLGQEIDPNVLGRIAKLSGGKYYHSPTTRELDGIFGDIARAIKTQYLLKYSSQAANGDHKLTVSLLEGGRTLKQEERRFRIQAPDIEVQIDGLVADETIQGKVEVSVAVRSARPIKKVEYYVNKDLVFTAPSDPFGWEWNASRLTGTHALVAKAYDTTGQTGLTEVRVNVIKVRVPWWQQVLEKAQELAADRRVQMIGGGAVVLVLLGMVAVPAVLFSRRPRYSFQGKDSDFILSADDLSTGSTGGVTDMVDAAPSITEGFDPMSDRLLGRLTVESGSQAGKVFEVYDGDIAGREAGSIRLEDRTVSKSHVQFHLVGNQVQVQDLNSLNGVLINNRLKLQGNSAVLQGGERLRMGRTTLVFTKEIIVPEAAKTNPGDGSGRRPDLHSDKTQMQ